MKIEDYNKYYIQGSDHYLIPKDVFKELFNEMVNWKEESQKLKDNWNKLREWIVYNKHNENTEQHYLVVDYGTLLGKMQELEQGSDSNGS